MQDILQNIYDGDGNQNRDEGKATVVEERFHGKNKFCKKIYNIIVTLHYLND